ncbi:MAG: DUF2958 domain-containing protein [Candidatus Heimdallarchaeota archaeon]|nr:DUF2958 domain-containing protein [Candidatus Heimdallarchaeota archaeon]
MKLLTKEIRKQLPPIGAQDQEKDPMVYVKFFCPWNHWTWLAYEFDGEDIFFGFVKGDYDEFGTFSLSEMEGVRGPMKLGIERDANFTPQPLSRCK